MDAPSPSRVHLQQASYPDIVCLGTRAICCASGSRTGSIEKSQAGHAEAMAGVPDGMYYGGGESEEEDGGFVFGDSPPSTRPFIAEPTVAAVTGKVAAKVSVENGQLSSSEEEEEYALRASRWESI